MGKVGHQQQYVYDNDVCQSELILDSPPVAKGEEKQGHAKDKAVETHVKQVVVGEHKPEQSKDHISLLDTVEKIKEGKR